jgi:hypothetical protein
MSCDRENRATGRPGCACTACREAEAIRKRNWRENRRLTLVPDPEPEPVTLVGSDDWKDWAECAGTAPRLFFPERGDSDRDAKRVCARCPVQQQCLQYALDNGIRYGVWGGKSERQRRALRRQAREDGAA